MSRTLAISIGDPNGIGLEVALKAVSEVGSQRTEVGEGVHDLEVVFIGDPDLIRNEAEKLGLPCPEIHPGAQRYARALYGELSAEAGAASAAWVEEGIAACLRGEADALVTAPINKQAWDLAGVGFPGHTELLAERSGTERFGMLLAGKGLRVILATRHVPLRRVPELLNAHEIRLAVDLLCEGLPLFGVETPRIAVCGLNPHAGDGGGIGTEEEEWITPLIRQLRDEGRPVTGPVPADTVFHQAVNGAYDAVVALYHDQGLGPLKLWAFDQGVNITLGLPFIRTSPDHGTAFGIAGKGVARPDSMREALTTAAQLSTHPNPWRKSSPA